MKIIKVLKQVGLMTKENRSPEFALKVAKEYWANCAKTHGDTSSEAFEFYYKNILKIMEPTADDIILDAGCGGGELTYLFHKDGFNAKGFDSSEHLISMAKAKFGCDLFYVDDLVNMTDKKGGFTKIFLNNCFFYVHPKYYNTVLKNLYDITYDNGAVYLFDDPDYSKRNEWYKRHFPNILSFFLPIYDPYMAGFWVKTKYVERAALNIGFSKVLKIDSWAYYRSHHVLLKNGVG